MTEETNREVFEIVVDGQAAKDDLDELRAKMAAFEDEAVKAGKSLDEWAAKNNLGKTRRELANVGQTAVEVRRDFGAMAGGAAILGGALVGVVVALGGVRRVAGDWTEAHLEMDAAAANLAWRLDTSREAAERYLLTASAATGVGVGQIGGAPDTTAIKAQQVFGGNLPDWSRGLALTGTDVLDTYAAGMKKSGLASNEFLKIIAAAPGVQTAFNMGLEDTVALLSALVVVTGADERGVLALAGAMEKLYRAPELTKQFGITTTRAAAGGGMERLPMAQVMSQVTRMSTQQQAELAASLGLSNKEMERLFLTASAGWPEMSRLMQDVTGSVGEFSDAHKAATDNVSHDVDGLKNSWKNFLSVVGDTEVARTGIQNLRDMLVGLTAQITGARAEWQLFLDEQTGAMGLIAKSGKAGWLTAAYGHEIVEEAKAETTAVTRPGPLVPRETVQPLEVPAEAKAEVERFNFQRLKDVTPADFDKATKMLPAYERRLEGMGYKGEKEQFNFWVGSNQIARQSLATQEAMKLVLGDILDTEKARLEGMWNIPSGVTMRVPLQSLDMLRPQPGVGDEFQGPEIPTDLMAPVNQSAVNLDASAMALRQSAVDLSASALQRQGEIGAGAETGAGASLDVDNQVTRWQANAEKMARDDLKQEVNLGVGRAGAGGRVREAAVGGQPGDVRPVDVGAQGQVNATINTAMAINLDGRQIAKTVETYLVKDLANAARGGGSLRP